MFIKICFFFQWWSDWHNNHWPVCKSRILISRWSLTIKHYRYGDVSNGILLFQFKGILHQKIFYRPNLIFWIVMGCGIARFGRRGLKITKTWKFWSQNLSPGVSRRSRPGVSRHSTRGFEAQHQGFRGAATWGFEGQQHGVSRGSNKWDGT